VRARARKCGRGVDAVEAWSFEPADNARRRR
jgi:hypothetical protein